jgi:hypothetical protein
LGFGLALGFAAGLGRGRAGGKLTRYPAEEVAAGGGVAPARADSDGGAVEGAAVGDRATWSVCWRSGTRLRSIESLFSGMIPFILNVEDASVRVRASPRM